MMESALPYEYQWSVFGGVHISSPVFLFTSRVPITPGRKITGTDQRLQRAEAEVRRLRGVQPEDLDEAGIVHISPDYLEVLQAWDSRDLPRHLDDISDDEAATYVERHFTLLGMPAARVAAAARRLSTSDLDVAELRPESGAPQREASRRAGTVRTQRGRAASRTANGSNVKPLHGERR